MDSRQFPKARAKAIEATAGGAHEFGVDKSQVRKIAADAIDEFLFILGVHLPQDARQGE